MSAPMYTQVPPSDFQSIQTSYPPPPGQNEKRPFDSNVEERGSSPSGLLYASTPQTGFQRFKFKSRTVSHRLWLFEAGASLFSLIIFAVILGILKWYDNEFYGDASTTAGSPKNRPRLFPVLAILGAIMRAAMLLPVATAIGQLKWGWFRQGRRLLDMERFDEAARGILGSAKLIWTLRFRNIAVVGAALTILALPLDAVIQSAVLIPSKLVPNTIEYPLYPNITDKTSLPRSTWFDSYQTMDTLDRPWPSTGMMNAIKFGYGYTNGLSTFITAVTNVDCPTGYCSFKKSQTLAIRHQCVDRTAAIETIPASDEIAAYQTLSETNLEFYYNGATVGNETYEKQIIAAESYTTWPNTTYGDILFDQSLGPLIIRTSILMSLASTDETDAASIANQTIAAECALYWSINTSEGIVDDTTNFKLNNTVTPMMFDIVREPEGTENLWLLTPDECFVEGETVAKNLTDVFYINNCQFAVGKSGGGALQRMLLDDLDGFNGVSYLKNATAFEWTRTNDFVTNIYAALEDNKFDRDLALGEMETMWGNLAFAMSSTVKYSKSKMEGDDADSQGEQLLTSGSVYRPIFYYSIDWPRLAAPGFVVALAAFFVLYTAIVTRKEYAWRRSALPLLFHGIEERERVALGDVRSFITMQDVAQKLHVRLDEHVDANGARLTTQHR
ncbi:hypothetical protein ACN47E_009599 [Coniothyrium glycines]